MQNLIKNQTKTTVKKYKKVIHLLYVPTMHCNMSCSYCYLGDLTNVSVDNERALETLKVAVKNFLKNGYLPYNISLHGGEVTTIKKETLAILFDFIEKYYIEHEEDLKKFGFSKKPNHIKTNLYNIDTLMDVLDKYKVSISGSVDLPLFLHKKYRITKNNKSTLDKILQNLKLLAKYKHNKKISCVVTKEHLKHIDAFIKDIKYIHNEIGFDMTKFNIMFSFDSKQNEKKFQTKLDGTEMLNDHEMVFFYNELKKAFMGTNLEKGFKKYWFEEFTPNFCCSAQNCGSKFFLLQSDGNVFSCPRGQSNERYKYGNIYKEGIEKIVNRGFSLIQKNENELDIHEDCSKCEYIKYCNNGCTFVRDETGLKKSYTCQLQKTMYKEDKQIYPPMTKGEVKDYYKFLLFKNNIKTIEKDFEGKKEKENETKTTVTPELFENRNTLSEIIKRDKNLIGLYDDENFKISINGKINNLKSQNLKNENSIEILSPDDEILLYVKKEIFSHNASNEVYGNNLLIMCLRETIVQYGDEERQKQEHLFDYSVYYKTFQNCSIEKDGYFIYNLKPIIEFNQDFFINSKVNNLFFTTKKLREYHYTKHKKNAFYHIQAINLPFQNFGFIWMKNE